MKQFKICSYDFNKNKKTEIQFFELKENSEMENLYFKIEKEYIEIIYDIIGFHKKIYFEFDCSLFSEEKQFGFYTKEELLLYRNLIKLDFEEKLEIEKNHLKIVLTFILREHINGTILNENGDVLYGYIYDFESLVYSDRITEEQIKEINKRGFKIEEFYFSFDFE